MMSLHAFVPTPLGFAVGSSHDEAIFFRERIPGDFLRLIGGHFPLFEKLGFKKIAVVHAADKVINLVGI